MGSVLCNSSFCCKHMCHPGVQYVAWILILVFYEKLKINSFLKSCTYILLHYILIEHLELKYFHFCKCISNLLDLVTTFISDSNIHHQGSLQAFKLPCQKNIFSLTVGLRIDSMQRHDHLFWCRNLNLEKSACASYVLTENSCKGMK